jgi:hypothetical protein
VSEILETNLRRRVEYGGFDDSTARNVRDVVGIAMAIRWF